VPALQLEEKQQRDWLQDKSEGLGFCSDERRIATHGFYQA
jgi:hypothetical protein